MSQLIASRDGGSYQLHFRANVRGKGSYAIVAREMVVGLWRLGADIVVDPALAGTPSIDYGIDRETILQRVQARTHRPVGEQIHVRYLSRPNEREIAATKRDSSRDLILPGVANICFLAIDGTRLTPNAHYDIAQGWDLMVVPSRHSERALLASGTDPDRVAVVPHGVDTTLFHPAVPAMELPLTQSFKFLLNCTPWIDRKNIEGALRAYLSTFTDGDDVVLVVHSPLKDAKVVDRNNQMTSFSIHGRIRALAEQLRNELQSTATIHWLMEDLPLAQMPALNNACDCLIHPHRAEGFGLAIAEAMACGLPTIVTPWGGNMDYCSHETNLFIPFELVHGVRSSELTWAEPEPEPIEWASPDPDALAVSLLSAVNHRDQIRNLGMRAASRIRSGWSWTDACERFLATVEQRLSVAIAAHRG